MECVTKIFVQFLFWTSHFNVEFPLTHVLHAKKQVFEILPKTAEGFSLLFWILLLEYICARLSSCTIKFYINKVVNTYFALFILCFNKTTQLIQYINSPWQWNKNKHKQTFTL